MAILALGVSYRRAPIDLLERLAFADDDLTKAYRRALDLDAVGEAVVLSTCNRVEVYGTVDAYRPGFIALKRLIAEPREVDPDELAESLYAHYETEAADHLFRVAGGLDSMVLGEPQILTQVRGAHRRAATEGMAGAEMARLFHAAARTGRRIRTETGVGAAPDTFVDVGADLAARELGGLEGRSAVVVGAGLMSALATKHLRGRGVGAIRILNRSLERAQALAERTSAEPGDLTGLPAALAQADLLISATGATGLVISEGTVRAALDEREAGRSLFVLDLAVPRDVEPSVGSLPGIRLVDIEGLRHALAERATDTARHVEQAEAIVAEEVRRFTLARRTERLAPLIRAMRDRGEQVVAAELGRFRSRLADLTPDEREAVEALARGIVAKLLHDPIVRLKEADEPGADLARARLLADLLGIEHPPE